jgi:NADH/NAD ratio-sensing transcriptional regulator Rex
MEILGKIFGSTARVKIMRLFISNVEQTFESKDIVARSRVNSAVVRKELSLLSSIGFIKKKKQGYYFNLSFQYARQIENLIVGVDMFDRNALLKTFKKAGKVKLIIVSGAFIKSKDSRVDLLIVGDKIKRKTVEDGLKKIEAEIGTELTYAVFDTEEFVYRLNMYDKLVRDILDFTHEVLLESKELSTQYLKKP